MLRWAVENNEGTFLLKIKSKDKASLEQVVHLHTKHLHNTCLGMNFTRAEADDITQSVWLTFFDIVHKFEGRSSIRTFLFGILYNKISEYRKESKKAEPTENIETLLDSHFDNHGHWKLTHIPVNPEKFMQSCQMMDLISKCLEQLPLNQKMAFILKEIEETITEEICNILNISTTNLGVLLFRAKNQLRLCIDRKSR